MPGENSSIRKMPLMMDRPQSETYSQNLPGDGRAVPALRGIERMTSAREAIAMFEKQTADRAGPVRTPTLGKGAATVPPARAGT